MRQRAARAVAGDAAIDQGRIDYRQRRIPQLQAFHDTGAEALDQDVGVDDAPTQRLATGVGAQVESQQLLVAVQRVEVGLAGR